MKNSATTEYAVIYERDGDGWGASVPDLPGCHTCGDTLEEVQEFVKEAIELYLEDAISRGDQLPPSSHYAGMVKVELSA